MIAGVFACECKAFWVGILQLITAPILIGIIWSIVWGWELYQTAKGRRPAHGQHGATVA